ncbi:MAG: hypothetical protein ACT4QF_09755 [Sporichthyaceae bacterium]
MPLHHALATVAGRRVAPRTALVVAGLVVATLPGTTAAHAMPAPSDALTAAFPQTVEVGGSGQTTITGKNIGSAPVTVSAIRVLPACGGAVSVDGPLGCTTPEPGVFEIGNAVATGACGSVALAVATDSETGVATLTPQGALILAPGATCTVTFTQTALKALANDVDSATDGSQTTTGVGVLASVGTVSGELNAVGNTTTVTVPATR